MRRAICLLICLLLAYSASAETIEATPEAGPLTGITIGIDPGHQLHGDSAKEAIAPGSSETKARVSGGTSGVNSRIPEHEVNLQISLKLRDSLTALGATVVMSRETADVNISNIERAVLMNEAGADLVLRIHCNGAKKQSANGIGLYVRKTGAMAQESAAYAGIILGAMTEATGANATGVHTSDSYTGLNWSEVPCILVETGYLTNPEEDALLTSDAYQSTLVEGMVNGILTIFTTP